MEKSKVAVVIVPLPSQSHLTQLLLLAATVSSYGFPVHYVCGATQNRQVIHRAATLKPEATADVKFHDIPFATNTHPIFAFRKHGHAVADIVQEVSSCVVRTVVVYDRFVVDVVGEAVSIPGVVSYAFYNLSAYNVFHVLMEIAGKPLPAGLPRLREIYEENFFTYMSTSYDHFNKREGDIFNTCRSIEGQYINLLGSEELGGKKVFALWPSRLLLNGTSQHDKKVRHACLQWLDRQPPKSVMLVCFGSHISLTRQQMDELAAGLEGSGERFIWVVKEADKADIFAGEEVELPEGFEERVGERGVVVRGWAPQMEILSHKATGAFMTHCGVNSTVESLYHGVPVATWPMNTDQPVNAYYLTEILKVGVPVRDWEKGDEVVPAAVIRNAVERLLSAEEGAEVRKRAEEISATVNKSMEEGGEQFQEIDNFIAQITR